MTRWPGAVLLVLALLFTPLGCDRSSRSGAGERVKVQVFAAASLSESLTELKRVFEQAHPDVELAFNFAGSSTLATQVLHGAPADLFLSADRVQAERVSRSLNDSEVTAFLANRMVIVAHLDADRAIESLSDLGRPDVAPVFCSEDVPAGRYSRLALRRALGDAGAASVIANARSLELDVTSVVTKVARGEADAGIVYATDVRPDMTDSVRIIELPRAAQVRAEYVLVNLRPGEGPTKRFISFLRSEEARSVFDSHGFESVDDR